jgi:DNA recombination protein RmuC
MNAVPPELIALLVLAVVAAGATGWALMERRRAALADARAWDLQTRFGESEARLKIMDEQSGAQAELFRIQAQQSAHAAAEALIARTDETFRNREQLSQARLDAQLKPVAETLAKFEAQVQAIEKTRAEDNGGLKAQITALLLASESTQAEARKLSAALRRGAGVQGRWGEQTLRNVLETAGLHTRFDFEEQFSVDTEEGRRRPDVKVRLPGGGVFVIDAKCSLNAFLDAQETTDETVREAALMRHTASVKAHMTGLSAKAYWDQFAAEGSPDFVAMFVPGDSFLAAALDRAPDLMTEAMERKVLLVTPTTLFALCKAVSYGWRVEDQAKGAAKIAELGRELYKRISVMGAHAGSVGKALGVAVDRYNQFVGSLESQVLTQARRFEDLSVDHQGKAIDELQPLENAPRNLSKLAATEPLPGLTEAGEPPTSPKWPSAVS